MRKQPLPPNCAWKPDESASSHAEKRVKGRIFASRTEKKNGFNLEAQRNLLLL